MPTCEETLKECNILLEGKNTNHFPTYGCISGQCASLGLGSIKCKGLDNRIAKHAAKHKVQTVSGSFAAGIREGCPICRELIEELKDCALRGGETKVVWL